MRSTSCVTRPAALLVVMAIGVAGCASLQSVPRPVNSDQSAGPADTSCVEDLKTQGFRYYLPKPYLLISQSKDGSGIQVETMVLPDYERAYYVSSSTLFASNLFEVGVKNGMLQTVKSEVDTTGVPVAALPAATEIAKAAQAAKEDEEEKSVVAQMSARLQELQDLKDKLTKFLSKGDQGAPSEEEVKNSIAAVNAEQQRVLAEVTKGIKEAPPVPTLRKPEMFEVVASPTSLKLQKVNRHGS